MLLRVIGMDSRTESSSYGWTIECKVERGSENCLGLSEPQQRQLGNVQERQDRGLGPAIALLKPGC